MVRARRRSSRPRSQLDFSTFTTWITESPSSRVWMWGRTGTGVLLQSSITTVAEFLRMRHAERRSAVGVNE